MLEHLPSRMDFSRTPHRRFVTFAFLLAPNHVLNPNLWRDPNGGWRIRGDQQDLLELTQVPGKVLYTAARKRSEQTANTLTQCQTMHLAGKTIENAGDRLSFIRRCNSSPEKPKVHHTRLFNILHLRAECKGCSSRRGHCQNATTLCKKY
jgi:hypothetical protein